MKQRVVVAPVSVGIPVLNEARSLPRLLESLLSQAVIPSEILIVDGDSTDDTVEVARKWASSGVRVLQIGRAYPGRGRNHAIAAARHEWVALIDAGCIAEEGWLAHLLHVQEAGGPAVGAVFGDYAPEITSEWDMAQALALVPARERESGCRPLSIASSLVSKAAWKEAGGFPENLRAAEDLLFFDRLRERSITVLRAPAARIRWSMARSPKVIFRRFRLYSAYHVAAGLYHTWHLRVMAMDLVGAGLAISGLWWPWIWAVLGSASLVRVVRTIARRRQSVDIVHPYRPDRLIRVAILLFLADAATWAGVLDYARGRVRQA